MLSVVISGKDHSVEVTQIRVFLWEMELLSMTRKAQETDPLSYASSSDKAGPIAQGLHFFAFCLCCVRNRKQTKPIWVDISFPLYFCCFPKNSFGFWKLSVPNMGKCWLTQDLSCNYLPQRLISRYPWQFLHSSFWLSCRLIHLHFSLALKQSRIKQRIHNYKTALWLHESFSPHAYTHWELK